MLHRKTDNSPVTDESLARVRDEIAEAYSHASPDTITLDTQSAIDRTAATARLLRAELQKAESLWAQASRERDDAVALLRNLTDNVILLSEQSNENAVDLLGIVRREHNPNVNDSIRFLSRLSRADGAE